MIKRIFHTIGQGAFYSERHEGFNIVYDCGALPKSNAASRVVRQSFIKSDEIDILFISHFDSDHVNEIETLKKHCSRIKVVVLPLLEPNEKKILINFYQSIGGNNTQLISNPNEYFGKGTNIVFVKPSENQEQNDDQLIALESLTNNQEINSSTKIKKDNDWYFIPYNFKFKERHQQLINLLEAESIDIVKISSNLEYALSKRKDLRTIYNKLEGKINQNSMFLYSGPIKDSKIQKKPFRIKPSNFPLILYSNREKFRNPGCIYTGDSDLNVVNIKQIFKDQWEYVGTIQIPHHGDIKSYNSAIFNGRDICCPISVGLKNTYGHPSNTVVADLNGNNNLVFCVTEDKRDLYFEIIY